MTERPERILTPGRFVAFAAAMCLVVAASNILVQHPVQALGLQDLLTWGAFTYPIAFLVTDLANRLYGAAAARSVVLVGFTLGVALSVFAAVAGDPEGLGIGLRIALASGTAFLLAQLLDVSLFDRLREGVWWRAPLVSSVLAAVLDTTIFFSLAFAALPAAFWPLSVIDGFAVETIALFGTGLDAPRWTSWAIGDLGAKLATVTLALLPYRVLSLALARPQPAV